MINEKPSSPLADDLIEGVDAIAEFLGLPRRRVQHLVDLNKLPGTFRMGRRICALKSKIRDGLEALATGEAA